MNKFVFFLEWDRLLPLITKLDIDRKSVCVSNMVNLRHLCAFSTSHIEDLYHVPEKLTILTIIELTNQKIPELFYLITNFAKLNVIQNVKFLNLSALNDERKECENACKLTIYLMEGIYLATKEAANTTCFDLI